MLTYLILFATFIFCVWKFAFPKLLQPFLFVGYEKFPKTFHTTELFDKVVIIGSSMAGMSAAQVMSKYSKEVILLEQASGPRGTCVPHSSQVHVLWQRGLQTLNRIFPGIENEIKKHPLTTFINWDDADWIYLNAPRAKLAEDQIIVTPLLRRSSIEEMIHSRIETEPKIRKYDGTCVTNILFDPDNPKKVVGVTITSEGAATTIHCDLVIDCGGVYHPSSTLFQTKGLEKTHIRSKILYSAATFGFQNPKDRPSTIIYYQSCPQQPIGAILVPINDHEALVSFIATNSAFFPRSVEEYRACVAKMPVLEKALEKSNNISTKARFQRDGNIVNHYEKLELEGFLAIGDSLCSFNPVYGQGQTVALEESLFLDYYLSTGNGGKTGWTTEVQYRFAQILMIPFIFATSSDAQFEGTTMTGDWKLCFWTFVGKRLLPVIFRASSKSSNFHSKFLRVIHSDLEVWKQIFTWRTIWELAYYGIWQR